MQTSEARHVERVYGSPETLQLVADRAADAVDQLKAGDDAAISNLAVHATSIGFPTPIKQRLGDPFPYLDAIDIVLVTPRASDNRAIERLWTHVWNAVAPFNESEMAAILALCPETLQQDPTSQLDPLSGETLWIHDHLLLERVGLVIALERNGLDPRTTVVFAKADETLYGRRVHRTLEERGYKVIDSEMFGLVLAETSDPTCIIDDGGALIQHVMERERGSGSTRTMIETTSKGMRALRLAKYADEVIDLASSSVKLGLSRAIASSFVRQILTSSQHARVDRTTALVFGFGNLGAHVTEQLTAIGIRCSVIEPNPKRRAEASAAGYLAAERATDVGTETFDWMVGCSGTPSIDQSVLAHLRDGGRLCAVASNDLTPIFRSFGHVMRDTPYGRVFDHDGAVVKVLGDGHALNLFRSEGVPEPDFDRFQSQIVRTLIAAVSSEASHLLRRVI
ncbi:S-adenosylhomocysteine hydrolase [Microbacterium natoriense]|uniref:S-adenosylhomocysteine hydrolase n=1 Tax=Microbacterium natoriense TaxID=284570 RepID=A0AAW8F0L7_9MICO|nr:hypothetical protein [Microbacterium natoriense]MDQ0648530.1 S-adenosylhomocysteine hydrolase [Microbacterium natoriense]